MDTINTEVLENLRRFKK